MNWVGGRERGKTHEDTGSVTRADPKPTVGCPEQKPEKWTAARDGDRAQDVTGSPLKKGCENGS